MLPAGGAVPICAALPLCSVEAPASLPLTIPPPVHPLHLVNSAPQVLPLVVQSLPTLGQRATYVRAFLWAMPGAAPAVHAVCAHPHIVAVASCGIACKGNAHRLLLASFGSLATALLPFHHAYAYAQLPPPTPAPPCSLPAQLTQSAASSLARCWRWAWTR